MTQSRPRLRILESVRLRTTWRALTVSRFDLTQVTFVNGAINRPTSDTLNAFEKNSALSVFPIDKTHHLLYATLCFDNGETGDEVVKAKGELLESGRFAGDAMC